MLYTIAVFLFSYTQLELEQHYLVMYDPHLHETDNKH